MKSKKLLLSSLLLFAGVVTFISLTSTSGAGTGVMGASSIGCGGTGCHAVTTAGGTIDSIMGIPNPCIAGTTYVCTLAVINTTKVAAGFDLSVSGGQLSGAPANTMLMGSTELHHTAPLTMVSGVAAWTFNWKAPSTPGAVVFNVAGNAVNGNTNESGDAYAVATKTFQVTFATHLNTAIEDNDFQVYPNPTTDFLQIKTARDFDKINFTFISLTGNIVQIPYQKTNAGQYRLDTKSLATGNYFIQAQAAGYRFQYLFSKK